MSNEKSLNEQLYDLYTRRIEEKLSWADISDIIEKTTGQYISPEAARKRIARINFKNSIEDSAAELDKIKLERKKLADERTQNNAIYRRISREETI